MRTKSPHPFSARALPWVLLAVSVALNVFFIGGHVYGRYYAEKFHGPDRRAADSQHRRVGPAERLKLDTAQRTAFREMRRSMRAQGKKVRAANTAPMDALWQEMSSASPNDTQIETLLRSMADRRFAFQVEATRFARDFMAKLTPDQRTRFIKMARRRNIFARSPDARSPYSRPRRHQRPERRPRSAPEERQPGMVPGTPEDQSRPGPRTPDAED